MGGVWNSGKETIVFIDDSVVSPDEILATIIHESVHVWQSLCDYILEKEPSIEMEAYCIEYIAMTLIKEHSRLAAIKEKASALHENSKREECSGLQTGKPPI